MSDSHGNIVWKFTANMQYLPPPTRILMAAKKQSNTHPHYSQIKVFVLTHQYWKILDILGRH